MSVKNSNDTIENRNHDLPVCSALPQPTVPSRAPSTIQVRGTTVQLVQNAPGCDTLLHSDNPGPPENKFR